MAADWLQFLFFSAAAIWASRAIQREFYPAQARSVRKPQPRSIPLEERFRRLRKRHVRIVVHPVVGPTPWHTLWRTGQAYLALAPLLTSWGRVGFSLRRPPSSPPAPPGLYRVPAHLVLHGSYGSKEKQGFLTIRNRPAGSLILWKRSPLGPSVPLFLVVPEPHRITLSYRSSGEFDYIRRFLRAIFALFEMTPIPEGEALVMNQTLEEIAATSWAQRPENRPLVAFYLTLSRLRFLMVDEETYGLGDLWAPLASYLQPSMVAGMTPTEHAALQRTAPWLLALMYHLRAYTCSYDPIGLTTRLALEDLDRALALEPPHPEFYWLTKGAFLCREKAYTQALEAYAKAMQAPTTLPYAAYARAVVYYHLRDAAQARRDLLLGWRSGPPKLRALMSNLIQQVDPDFPLRFQEQV